MLLVAATFTACDSDDSEGLTRITYYPTLELVGDATLYWDKGTVYVDPGYYSELNGEDVSDQVTVSGTVDYNTSGIYTLTYTSVVNEDGFSSSASRTVIVLDANDPVEGVYAVSPTGSYRLYNGATTYYNVADNTVLVINYGDGIYYTDDLLGGWYCVRAGYGTNYACQGYFSIGTDGSITLLDSYVPGWGDSLDWLTGTFDSATSNFELDMSYAGYLTFHVSMTKQ